MFSLCSNAPGVHVTDTQPDPSIDHADPGHSPPLPSMNVEPGSAVVTTTICISTSPGIVNCPQPNSSNLAGPQSGQSRSPAPLTPQITVQDFVLTCKSHFCRSMGILTSSRMMARMIIPLVLIRVVSADGTTDFCLLTRTSRFCPRGLISILLQLSHARPSCLSPPPDATCVRHSRTGTTHTI